MSNKIIDLERIEVVYVNGKKVIVKRAMTYEELKQDIINEMVKQGYSREVAEGQAKAFM